MSVSIAEYLGNRTDVDNPRIQPVEPRSGAMCPFMDRECDKVAKGNAPVCSVRKNTGEVWIVCEHRLCSTRQVRKVPSETNPGRMVNSRIGLVAHQKDIIRQVAEVVYREPFDDRDIIVKREATIPLPDTGNNYHADYIMRNMTQGAKIDEILLEMQGGGETSNTGAISRHVVQWANENKDNEFLRSFVTANPLETNAWRRQQEQFLVKGNVVDQTGGKIVFAVGTLLYNYLESRFRNAGLRDLRGHNWTLCILAFGEQHIDPIAPGPIPLEVDTEKLLFTNYSTFVRFLTDQGSPCTEIFEGEFLSLTDETRMI